MNDFRSKLPGATAQEAVAPSFEVQPTAEEGEVGHEATESGQNITESGHEATEGSGQEATETGQEVAEGGQEGAEESSDPSSLAEREGGAGPHDVVLAEGTPADTTEEGTTEEPGVLAADEEGNFPAGDAESLEDGEVRRKRLEHADE